MAWMPGMDALAIRAALPTIGLYSTEAERYLGDATRSSFSGGLSRAGGFLAPIGVGLLTGGPLAAGLAGASQIAGSTGMADRWSILGAIGAAAAGYGGGGGISGAIGGVTTYLGGGGGYSGGPLPTIGGGAAVPGPTGFTGACPPGTIRGPLGTCVNLPFGGAPGTGITTQGGTGVTFTGPTQVQAQGGKPPSGYHWNRQGYFTKSQGWIPEGTKLVKNRRKNPLNPKAASRAIARLESAKNASRALSRVTIRKKSCCK